MSTAPVIATASEAMEMVHAGLAFLASADAAALGAAVRARLLRDLEEADSVATAVRTSVLGAFGAGQDYTEDGDYSPFSWLLHRTQVTRGTAADHTGWGKRGAGHPAVLAALATRKISKSYAREICWWTGKLPEDSRAAADEILLAAAGSGLDLHDLAGLAGEMYERSRPGRSGPGDGGSEDAGPGEDPGEEQGRLLDDRSVKLATTIGGAGVINGDLTPECAEFVQTVLDALCGPAGADDDRTHGQRYHDALEEAMRRLVAGGLVPARSGQPLRVWAYISLADLMQLEGSAELVQEWMEGLRARWAGQRAAAAEAGGHQGLWLDGDAARGVACGAPVAPVVLGEVDPAAFGDLIRLCAQLDRLLHGDASDAEVLAGPGDAAPGGPGGSDPGAPAGAGGSADADVPAAFSRARSREALEQAIIGKAAELLSGPGGLASFLRRRALGGRLGGPSLPLDIGYARTVPAGIRNAARIRGRHCEWAGGCGQPAGACQVHHVRHLADGGPTSLAGCVLLCFFHHQVMIHQRGWTLVVNPDGTTTAWNKDKTKVLHSHGPPARPG
ncbi:MAG: DUF222 domain-containing protein [Streptosporangiaceae bacterium]|jgi:hypothetical protein